MLALKSAAPVPEFIGTSVELQHLYVREWVEPSTVLKTPGMTVYIYAYKAVFPRNLGTKNQSDRLKYTKRLSM